MWYTRAQHKKRIKTRRMLDEPGSTAINDGVEVAPAPEIPPMDLQPSAPKHEDLPPMVLPKADKPRIERKHPIPIQAPPPEPMPAPTPVAPPIAAPPPPQDLPPMEEPKSQEPDPDVQNPVTLPKPKVELLSKAEDTKIRTFDPCLFPNFP